MEEELESLGVEQDTPGQIEMRSASPTRQRLTEDVIGQHLNEQTAKSSIPIVDNPETQTQALGRMGGQQFVPSPVDSKTYFNNIAKNKSTVMLDQVLSSQGKTSFGQPTNTKSVLGGAINVAEDLASGFSLTNPASFLLSAGVTGISSIASALIGASSSRDVARMTSDASIKQSEATNKQTDLTAELANREWDAAKSVGLATPLQFQNGASDIYQFNGRSVSRTPRTVGNSPYAM